MSKRLGGSQEASQGLPSGGCALRADRTSRTLGECLLQSGPETHLIIIHAATAVVLVAAPERFARGPTASPLHGSQEGAMALPISQISIFKKTGLVLWSRTVEKRIVGDPISRLIGDYLLEEKGGATRRAQIEGYSLEWRLVNEADLVSGAHIWCNLHDLSSSCQKKQWFKEMFAIVGDI